MKRKKLISIWAIILMLFIISPNSFALEKIMYDPNQNSVSSVRWQELQSGMVDIDGYYGQGLETFQVGVTQSGLYQASNMMGTQAPAQYMILQKVENADGTYSMAPVYVSTYLNKNEAGSITSQLPVSQNNNVGAKTTTVYLEEGKDYYVALMGDDGGPLIYDGTATSQNLDFILNYIEQPAGMELYETDILSTTYSSPSLEGTNRVYAYSEDGFPIQIDKENKKQNASTGDDEEGEGTEQNPTQNSNPNQVTQNELGNTDPNLNQSVNDSQMELNQHENSAFEKFITWFLVKGIGDNFRKILSEALGGNISIDSLLFNKFSDTRLSIFGSSRVDGNQNGFLEGSGLLDSSSGSGIISKYFTFFNNIAICCYIVILLYMGVRILLASTGSKKSKYKSMAMDWIKGIVILAFFPYVMKYAIVTNNLIVDYIGELKQDLSTSGISNITLPTITGVSDADIDAMNLAGGDLRNNGDIMQMMRAYALSTGRIAYAMLYLFLLKELVGFIYIYYKRLLIVIFLIMIFPLVTISYAVDKIGDGKSQAFDHWLKEYILNVFLQAFQAINYLVVMSVIFALTAGGGSVNVILVLIALEYLSKGDELLRGMFTKMSGGGASSLPKSLSEAVKTTATIGLVKDLSKKVAGVGGRVTNFTKSVNQVRTSYQNYELAKLNQQEEERKQQAYNFQYSDQNPESVAINNVADNIAVAFNLSGARSPEEVKEALDRLAMARNDPNRRELFEAEFKALSEPEREKLNKLMAANEAINSTINGNVGVNGKLTNREINLNFTVITDVLNGGSTGEYRDLYRFIEKTELKDAEGKPAGNLKDSFRAMQKGRVLNEAEQRSFKKVQQIVGGASGANDYKKVGFRINERTGSIQGAAGADGMDLSRKRSITTGRLYTMTNDEKRAAMADSKRIMTKVGASGSRAEAAAQTIAVVKEYSKRIEEGSQDGMTANEAMELSGRLRKLQVESTKEGDTETQNVLNQMQAELGFSIQQFETAASLAAINTYQNLEGNRQEQQEVLDEAYQVIRRIDKKSKDNVAKALIYRSEVDRILDGEIDLGERPVEVGTTVEEYRSKRQIAELRAEIEREYDRTGGMTVEQTRKQLIKDLGKSAVAGASVAGGAVSTVAGTTIGALYAGASGKAGPVEILGAMDLGITLEHTAESLVPGTQYAEKNKKSIGKKIDNAIDNRIKNNNGKTTTERQTELDARIARNRNIQNKINSYRNHLQ